MMAATATVALALTLTQWMGIPLNNPGAICVALPMLIFALAIISFCFLTYDDLFGKDKVRELRNRIDEPPDLTDIDQSHKEQVSDEGIAWTPEEEGEK